MAGRGEVGKMTKEGGRGKKEDGKWEDGKWEDGKGEGKSKMGRVEGVQRWKGRGEKMGRKNGMVEG